MEAACKGYSAFSGMPEHALQEGDRYTLDVTTLKVFRTKDYQINMEKVDRKARVFVSRENGGAVKSWIHYMSVVQDGEWAVWTDDVFIDAGLLTPLVARIGVGMYRHRHKTRNALSLNSEINNIPILPAAVFEPIQTESLVLRAVTHEDAARINAYINDPRIYKNVARIAPNQSLDQTQDWISTLAPNRRAGLSFTYAICRDDILAGIISLEVGSGLTPGGLGYWLAPEQWGQGYTTEAGRALLAFGETHLGMGVIESSFFADNPASGRVLEKLGFKPFDEGPFYCAGRDQEIHTIATALRPK